MTFVASVVAYVAFDQADEVFSRITERVAPSISVAAALAAQSGTITISTTALANAPNDAARENALSTLTAAFVELEETVVQLKPDLMGSETKRSLLDIARALSGLVVELNANVEQRLAYDERYLAIMAQLDSAYADVRDDVEPMIDDARFQLELLASEGQLDARSAEPTTRLRSYAEQATKVHALQRLLANSSLSFATMRRARNAQVRAQIQYISGELATMFEVLERDLNHRMLIGLPSRVSLAQAITHMHTLWDGPGMLAALSGDEVSRQTRGQRLVELTQASVSQLNRVVNERVSQWSQETLSAAAESELAAREGRIALIVAAIASGIVAVGIAWFYVGGNVVPRIRRLDASMRAIADGDLNTAVATGGSDEIAHMAEALRSLRDRLSETLAELVQTGKLAALGQLSAGIAHELSQPLATIRADAHNAARLMERESFVEARGTLRGIDTQIERVATVIRLLLNFSRRASEVREDVNVITVVENALTLTARRLRDEQIEMETQLPPGPVIVQAEEVLLDQVLINLITNAVDAMSSSETRKLTIQVREHTGRVTIDLADTGPGIPADLHEKVFEPFFTTKETGQGTGLGLSISYNIVTDLGGKLRVSETSEGGSNFRVTLPLDA